MGQIKWFKNQADQWSIIHSYLSNVTPLDTIVEDETWDQPPPTQTSPTQTPDSPASPDPEGSINNPINVLDEI